MTKTLVGLKGWLVVGVTVLVVSGACKSVGGSAVPTGVGGARASQGGPSATTTNCAGDGPTVPAGGANGGMIVTLLGTGSPVPSPDRAGSSTLIEAAGLRLVFDVGRGTTIRLWQKQIPLGTITAHFLTHLHSDHVNGLPDLWLSGWIRTPFGSRTTPFVVYGPPGTQKMMAGLWDAFSEDRRIRMADEMTPLGDTQPLGGIEIDAHDVGPGLVYCARGVSVFTFDVDHGDLVKPARGYKITYGPHTVVLSGDTRYSASVETAARGADVLIHEVAMVPKSLIDRYPAYQAVMAHHISPEDAGRLFAAAKPRLAVYSHIVLSGLPSEGIPFTTPAELLAATRTTYAGPVVVGSDLMAFRIDDSGISTLNDGGTTGNK